MDAITNTIKTMNTRSDDHDRDDCAMCAIDDVGCDLATGHHGLACTHPTCSDCGCFLGDGDMPAVDNCPDCGKST